jgi:hypothetical protein
VIRRKLIWAAASFSLALAGCAPTTQTVGLGLKSYSPAQQKQIAREYPMLPPDVQTMLSDYGLLRKETRALGLKR